MGHISNKNNSGRIRQKNTREDKTRKSLQINKPTANLARRQGITIEQLNAELGGSNQHVPKTITNNRYRKKIKKPSTIPNNIGTLVSFANTIVTSKYSLLPTPNWFKSSNQVDVSVIVPMYKSIKEIALQIATWDLTNDGLTKEIIYVNDACPDNSYEIITTEWLKRKQAINVPIGKIIAMESNSGYGGACNAGANVSQGKYLVFLNADCTVGENWIRPMYDLFADKQIGIVGNLQLRANGTIDSAGSEWSWNSYHFPHIGRNIYKGHNLSVPYKWNESPADLRQVATREMVTGCCFMIPRNIFMDVEGFDPNYPIGYWEDSDLNMKVRSEGFKVLFQPNSKVYHSLGHSKAAGHKYKDHNRKFFKQRWVDTGRIDWLVAAPRPADRVGRRGLKSNINGEVVGCIIACNEEEFLEASVDSIAPMVDRFVFVIGGNEYAYKAEMCDRKGFPTDNTLAIANKLIKKYPGIIIEPPGRLWQDKIEMRNAYVSYLKPGNWMFMLDGDEVYKERQLWRLTELMKEYECLILQFWLFWNNVNTIGTGSWGKYPQERLVKWREGFAYRKDNHLHVSDSDGVLVNSRYKTWRGQEKLFYHYSWIRPIKKIAQKRKYYEFQSNIRDNDYLNRVFLKWREDPGSVRETHPKGGGLTDVFPGIHPIQIQKLINEGKLNF